MAQLLLNTFRISIIVMRKHILLLPLLSVASFSYAGETLPPETETPVPEITSTPDIFKFFTPTVNIRTRFEHRELNGLDESNALTARGRFGLKTAEFSGFSAFAEAEGTIALVDDFTSNPAGSPSTRPFVPGNTPISDPNNIELNQAWVQYKNSGFQAKVGRQRIIRNNSAFIGNVGWRQNEQTFDAIEVGYSNDNFNISYVYSDRAQRIFGSDGNDALPGPPLEDFEGDFHFIDASYKFEDKSTLGSYVYLIDVDNNSNVGESNTFGIFYKNKGLHAEFAYQDGESTLFSGGDYNAVYGHVKYTHKVGKSSFVGGVEYLEEGFKTPLATVHAFNGFADAFVLNRIGLSNSGGEFEGITDIYVGYNRTGILGNMTFKSSFHYFLDDSLSTTYGHEIDAVLIKPINDNLKAILKAAYFQSDSEGPFNDIKQVTVELNYTF